MTKADLSSVLAQAAVLVAFAAVGGLTGWLVGGSATPVVAAVLPLVFGLTSGIGFGYARAIAQLKMARELVAGDAPDLKSKLTAALGESGDTESRLTAFWAIAVVVFCSTCFVGVRTGVQLRVPEYPSLSALTNTAALSPPEAAELHGFRLALLRQNLSPRDVGEVFAHVIAPFFQDARYRPGGELAGARLDALRAATRPVLLGAQAAQGQGRGPASSTDDSQK